MRERLHCNPAAATIMAQTAPLRANPPLTTEQQLGVLNGLTSAVMDHYVYPEAADQAWLAEVAEARARVEAGLDTEAFYAAIPPLLNQLGDEHSYFQSPVQVAEDEASIAGTFDFVGVGALFQPLGETGKATVLAVLEGGPAWYAGIQQHDVLAAVDGGPIREPWGRSRTLGPECSAVVLTIRSPGQTPRDLTLIRASVSGQLPIYSNLFRLPTVPRSAISSFRRSSINPCPRGSARPSRLRMLDGLILDNRMNGGGLGSVTSALLSHFVSGHLGDYVSREAVEPLVVEADPVHNSQQVPLVVLVGEDTVSYGEVFAGILQDLGRARIVGETTLGNVEQLRAYDFGDGSRAWLASARFEAANTEVVWEAQGIIPEAEVIAAWDTFTFETDPAVAAALELLGH
jgi:C-terminal processing protease CtpA/Prc